MARTACLICFCIGLLGCTEEASRGTLQVLLRGEDTIADGLAAGDALEDVVDGWSVRFDTWIATVGHVHIDRSDGEGGARDGHAVRAVDLIGASSRGVEVARFDDIASGRWDVFEFETPSASGGEVEAHDSVSDDAFDALTAADATFLIEGALESDEGESCPPGGECRAANEIRFSFAVPAETYYGPCSAEEGLAGAVVNEGGITTVAITLHGDHMFFDRFPVGAEVVERRAQWLADGDLDGDGEVTQAELEMIDAADLFDSALYALGGGPSDVAIDTAWDYVRAQMKTVGHFQGEGECPVDGASHDHGH